MALFRGRRTARRCFANVTAPTFQFTRLCIENNRLLPPPIVTKRVLQYLLLDDKDTESVFSKNVETLSLYQTVLCAPEHTQKLTPLVQWSFQHLLDDNAVAADAIFSALKPLVNLTGAFAWRQYFQQQFFLSRAPLQAYLLAYKNHSNDFGASEDDLGTKREKGDGKGTRTTKKHDVRQSQGRAVTTLAEMKWKQWVPFDVSKQLVVEFCYRGRFAEALEAYVALRLTNDGRCRVVTVLQKYEQYPSILRLYEIHRAMGRAVKPLDVAPELLAFRKMGRLDEMKMRFEELPAKEQSRADIQEIVVIEKCQ